MSEVLVFVFESEKDRSAFLLGLDSGWGSEYVELLKEETDSFENSKIFYIHLFDQREDIND